MGNSNTQEQDYLVLARKYRPQTFDDVVGQEALVTTITNAIKADKLHHAYVLTGIRGTGKTTTARLIAMSLNCENGPSTSWKPDDPQTAAIALGNHVDVLEFDAASHRGIDDIRDLFEGVAYAPVQGRYKVYIIDEVHMLTTPAFNALLKTLEEPPANVKFIFATTEVHKIPVTVLSRCQRFDLKRVPVDTLKTHYKYILKQEKLKADDGAFQLIARAADGSVRDGMSLLDQAIALAGDAFITTDLVSAMLGMADRAKVYDLLDALTTGDAKMVLSKLADFYALGQDGLLILQDMATITHLLTRLKVVPDLATSPDLTELEKTRAVPLAKKIPLENISRLYQMILTALNEAKQADKPFEAVEMACIRMAHLAALPSVADLMKQEPLPAPKSQNNPIKVSTPAPKKDVEEKAPWVEETPPLPTTWPDLVTLIKTKRTTFGSVLEQQARCIKLEDTTLELAIDNGLHDAKEISRDLRTLLKELTNTPWGVVCTAHHNNDVETLAEEESRRKDEKIEEAKADPSIQDALEMFPDAEVVEVS